MLRFNRLCGLCSLLYAGSVHAGMFVLVKHEEKLTGLVLYSNTSTTVSGSSTTYSPSITSSSSSSTLSEAFPTESLISAVDPTCKPITNDECGYSLVVRPFTYPGDISTNSDAFTTVYQTEVNFTLIDTAGSTTYSVGTFATYASNATTGAIFSTPEPQLNASATWLYNGQTLFVS
jgi:hypothetical protein